jgi:hypothetical protein
VFFGSAKFPAPGENFPALSLLGRKKFPARRRREFGRKMLESTGFFDALSRRKGRFPADSLRAGNFLARARSLSRGCVFL